MKMGFFGRVLACALALLMFVGQTQAAGDRIATRIVPDAPTSSLVASRIISVKPCKLYAVIVLNTSASLQYVQIHESATLPSDGAAPKIPSIPVSPGAVVMVDVGGMVGMDLSALTICNSSTAATKTIGSADCMISAVLAGD